ncbi:N-ethylmaleimide reductase [Providencia rustigianii]|nr:N-ethylmaleimide reductase [Providencia rustigianii]
MFVETAPGEGALADPDEPRTLSTGEVQELVKLYVRAARNAIEAGFDGVEIHSANGYLVNQFISEHTNHRTDQYGGSLRNRLRFLEEIVAAISEEVGAERLGVRFAPLFESTEGERVYLGLVESDPHESYLEAARILEQMGVAYISIAEADWDDASELPERFYSALRGAFSGALIYAGRYTPEKALRMLDAGYGDLFASVSHLLPTRICRIEYGKGCLGTRLIPQQCTVELTRDMSTTPTYDSQAASAPRIHEKVSD